MGKFSKFGLVTVLSLGLSMGSTLVMGESNAHAATWHKGIPHALQTKKYKGKYQKSLRGVARHYEHLNLYHTNVNFYGFQWGMKMKNVHYYTKGKTTAFRGIDPTYPKQYNFIKIRQISAKKISFLYAVTDYKSSKLPAASQFSSGQTLTRY